MKINATDSSPSSIHNRTLSFLCAISDHLLELVMSMESWRKRKQLDMQFAHIDPRTLRDAGISEARRFIEINKPFRQ